VTGVRELTTYLNDHLAASAGGLALAERARDAQRDEDPELARLLAGVTEDIRADKQQLERAMRAVGAPINPLKPLAGKVGELVGRLKLNGRLLGRARLSTLLELEGLTIAVQGKRALWLALGELDDPRLRQVDLGRLVERAEDQYSRLEGARRRAARAVLADR